MKRIITALAAVLISTLFTLGMAMPALALTQDHVDVYNQVNQYRAERGLPALAWNNHLNDHSQGQAQNYANGGGVATAPVPAGHSYTFHPRLIAGVSGSGQPTSIYASKWITDGAASASMAAGSPANSIGVGVAYGADGKAYVVAQIAGIKAIPKPAPVVLPAPAPAPAPVVVPPPVQEAPAPAPAPAPVQEAPAPAPAPVKDPAPAPANETPKAPSPKVTPTPTASPSATVTPTPSPTPTAVSTPDATLVELEEAKLKVLEAEQTAVAVANAKTGFTQASYFTGGLAVLSFLAALPFLRTRKEIPLVIALLSGGDS